MHIQYIIHIMFILHILHIMHIVTFIVSLSGFELSSDEDEPSLQPEHPDDIESGPLQPAPAAAPLLQQLPAPAAAPFDFASFMRETGGNTTALFSAIQKADGHLPKGPIHVYSERGGGGARLNILHMLHIIHILHIID